MCLIACPLPLTGLSRSKFDNREVSYETHTEVEHNMWHYLYFYVLVKEKDRTEFTGPESYVYEMVQVRLALKPYLCNIQTPVKE